VGGAVAQVEAVAEPAGGRGGLDAVVGPGGPAGVHGGQLGQPVAFQAVQQPPQPKDPLGRDRISQAVQVLGGQLLDRRRRVARLSGRPADGPVAWLADRLAELVALLVECVFESMAATYQPPAEHKHQTKNVDNPFAATRQRWGR
jgi:hypothetical protein